MTNLVHQTDSKREKKSRQGMNEAFAYLAGNAFGRDKKGKIQKDAGMDKQDMMSGGAGGDAMDYSAYVIYDLEIE